MMDEQRRDALETRCLDALADAGIRPALHHHPPVYTVEEARAQRGEVPGAHIKNLFLCDRKKRHFWLLTALEHQPIFLKALALHLDSDKRLRFANEGHMEELLGVEPGAVTPLAVMNDGEGRVSILLDRGILDHDQVNAHPLHNGATVTLDVPDLLRFLEHVEHPPRLLDLPAINAREP